MKQIRGKAYQKALENWENRWRTNYVPSNKDIEIRGQAIELGLHIFPIIKSRQMYLVVRYKGVPHLIDKPFKENLLTYNTFKAYHYYLKRLLRKLAA